MHALRVAGTALHRLIDRDMLYSCMQHLQRATTINHLPNWVQTAWNILDSGDIWRATGHHIHQGQNDHYYTLAESNVDRATLATHNPLAVPPHISIATEDALLQELITIRYPLNPISPYTTTQPLADETAVTTLLMALSLHILGIILPRLLLYGIRGIVAGGSILRCVAPDGATWGDRPDVDIFLTTLHSPTINRRPTASEIINAIYRTMDHLATYAHFSIAAITITSFAITFTVRRKREGYKGKLVKIQFILKHFSKPAEIVAGFDLPCCQIWYDHTAPAGKKVIMTILCHMALCTRVNIITLPTPLRRIRKYIDRGFAALDFKPMETTLLANTPPSCTVVPSDFAITIQVRHASIPATSLLCLPFPFRTYPPP
jgi:hypothetical protein